MHNDASDPSPAMPTLPRAPVNPPRPRSSGSALVGCFLVLSLLVNVLAGVALFVGCVGVLASQEDTFGVSEKFHSGSKSSTDKIAIVHLDGVIMEGMLNFVHKEIERAANDKNVKAVVFRVNSPGGSITASDDLHRRLVELRDGDKEKGTTGKPIVVSMGAVAASGGYYVAMPGKPLVAERTTMTGSIGVFGSFPNAVELSKKVGFSMTTIKQGKIKDSGSMFKDMTDEEKQVWQDLVDHAYQQFVQVVEVGRPKLKNHLLDPIEIKPVNAGPPDLAQKAKPYHRYRADGGVFTADKALEFGLIDQVGYVEDAIAEAKKQAALDDYKAVDYEKPKLALDLLLNSRATPPSVLSPALFRAGLSPHLWYLAPGSELSGILAASGVE